MRIVLSLLLLCATCVALGPASSTGDEEPFSIVISTDNPVVKAGSHIWIKVQMTNTSKEAIDCTVAAVNGIDRRFQYRVVNESDGKRVPKIMSKHPELEGGGSFKLCTLEPGSTTTRDALISALFDTSPGKYSIQVSRRVSDKEKDGTVKSNTITITVNP